MADLWRTVPLQRRRNQTGIGGKIDVRDWLPKSRVQHRIVLRSSRACSGVSSRDAAALEHFGYRNGRTTNLSSIDSELYVVDVDGHCSIKYGTGWSREARSWNSWHV